jgi:hypothetical protein
MNGDGQGSTPPSDSTQGGGLSTAQILGVVVGVFLCTLMLAVASGVLYIKVIRPYLQRQHTPLPDEEIQLDREAMLNEL